MSNLNKQAVYDLFFRIGKTAGITKIAKGGQPTTEELAEFERLAKLNNKEKAMVAEDNLYKKYPNHYRTIPRRFAAQQETEEQANTDNTKRLNLAKARVLGDLLASYRDRFESPDQGVSFAKNYGDNIENTNLISQLARLDSDSFDTSKNIDKYKKNPDLAKQRLDEIIDQAVKYPGIKEIMEDPNKSGEDKQNAISREMNKYYGEDSNLVHYNDLPQQQPSLTAASVAPAESDQIIDDQGISDAVNNLVEGFNRNRGASNNVTPTQKQEIAQDTSTQQSEPGFFDSLQSQAGDLGNYIKNQAGDLGNYIKNQAGDLGSAVKTQAGELSSALKNRYNQYQEDKTRESDLAAKEQLQKYQREQIRAQALKKAKEQALSNPEEYYYQEEDPQDTVVEQPSESNYPEISEEAIQSINPEVPATEPQTSSPTTAPIAAKPSKPAIRMLPLEDVQQEVTTPAPVAQPTTPATPQTPKLTGNALQRRLADLEAETKREEARQRAQAIVDSEAKKLNPIKADAKINKELAKLNRKPQVDTFDRTKALNNLKGGLGEQSPSYVDTSKIESDPISADRTYSSYLPAIDPSARLNFGMGETPPDLVFTEEDLAALNSQYPEASPIDTPPVVPQTPRANNNAPVAAKPSTQANDLLFNEPKSTPRSRQNLVREYYAMSNPPNPNAKTKQFYTIKNAPSQGYDPIQGITSRISTGNFGPAPSAPAARSQNRAVSAPRVARKPRPVAPKPTFDRKGYGDMMSDFGYNNTSPKPIPQNLTNLMPKRTTPINSVVGPAKPLDKILSNKPTATTSPAPKPVMDTTATTKAPPQIKQSFLSQFGIY